MFEFSGELSKQSKHFLKLHIFKISLLSMSIFLQFVLA